MATQRHMCRCPSRLRWRLLSQAAAWRHTGQWQPLLQRLRSHSQMACCQVVLLPRSVVRSMDSPPRSSQRCVAASKMLPHSHLPSAALPTNICMVPQEDNLPLDAWLACCRRWSRLLWRAQDSTILRICISSLTCLNESTPQCNRQAVICLVLGVLCGGAQVVCANLSQARTRLLLLLLFKVTGAPWNCRPPDMLLLAVLQWLDARKQPETCLC